MKKLTILFALLTLSAGLWAIDGVKYIDAKGQEQTTNNVTEITNSSDTLNAGWYVVTGKDVETEGLVCNGAVHLILADGAKLTAKGGNRGPGVRVSGEGNSLTIYGQRAQSGQLEAKTAYRGAGIGGGEHGNGSNITITGGTITATGGVNASGIGGGEEGNGSNITITGGTVTATGGANAAGIGGGIFCSGSNITISGGAVKATGGEYAAGIGGGHQGSGSNITINGGTVIATGGDDAAGIGGGNKGSGSNITITGGTVTATGGVLAAGIGGGDMSDGFDITIQDGTVTANGGENGTCIGSGHRGNGWNIKIFHNLFVYADNDNPPVEELIDPRTDATDIAGSLKGKRYVEIVNHRTKPSISSIPYVDEKGAEKTAKALLVSSSDTLVTLGKANATMWYFVPNETEVQFAKGAACHGNVRLVLGDGAKLTATGVDNQAGIQVSGEGNSLTIYGQRAQSGQLEAKGGKRGAGIGGGWQYPGSNIAINGGKVTATGGADAAGIGGGEHGNGSNITITGGTVTATGGANAAGIGGGEEGNGSNITITGGTVTATGGVNASGIGGGKEGSSSNVFIAPSLMVQAGYRNPPTADIEPGHTLTTDLADQLQGKTYAVIKHRTESVLIRVPYIKENGELTTIMAYILLSSDTTVVLGRGADTFSWYVALSTDDVQFAKGAVCSGSVHIILADEAKLAATGLENQAGIQVSGDDNSLTIYGQTEQSGQLFATGGRNGAGIGGGNGQDGSNISIYGGIVSATGGWDGAGIGGGTQGSGSNITINRGIVTATGVSGSAGIGGGWKGSGSNIKVDADLIIQADNDNPPKTIVASTRTDDTDIANELNGKKYVTILPSIISIAVKTDPTKVNYIEDEKFDPAGLVITATYSDNTTDDFAYNDYASNFTFSPALDAGLKTSNTQVTITYGGKSCTQAISVVAKKLLSIVIKTAPTKLEYNVGEHFNPAGLVITAAYNNNIPVDVVYNDPASDFFFDPALDAALQISTTKVTITYGGKSCTQPIVMFDKAAALAEIAAAMEGYEDSEYLNGLVATQITAIQNATTAAVVTANKEEAIAIIQSALSAYKAVLTEGYKRAKDELPTDDEDAKGAVVVITKGEKTLKLVNPDFVEYDKQE